MCFSFSSQVLIRNKPKPRKNLYLFIYSITCRHPLFCIMLNTLIILEFCLNLQQYINGLNNSLIFIKRFLTDKWCKKFYKIITFTRLEVPVFKKHCLYYFYLNIFLKIRFSLISLYGLLLELFLFLFNSPKYLRLIWKCVFVFFKLHQNVKPLNITSALFAGTVSTKCCEAKQMTHDSGYYYKYWQNAKLSLSFYVFGGLHLRLLKKD